MNINNIDIVPKNETINETLKYKTNNKKKQKKTDDDEMWGRGDKKIIKCPMRAESGSNENLKPTKSVVVIRVLRIPMIFRDGCA